MTQLKIIAKEMDLEITEGKDGGVAVCHRGAVDPTWYGSVEEVTQQLVLVHREWVSELNPLEEGAI